MRIFAWLAIPIAIYARILVTFLSEGVLFNEFLAVLALILLRHPPYLKSEGKRERRWGKVLDMTIRLSLECPNKPVEIV